MKQRLKQLRKTLKLTQGEFGKQIGMSDVAISYMESGRTALSNQNIKLISLTFKINEEWLKTGKGEIFNDDALLSDYERRLLDLFQALSPTAKKMLIEYAEKILNDEKALREEKTDSGNIENTG